MFDTVEAIRFDRVMSVGRTRPILLACERSSSQEVEVIAKFSVGCSIGGLIREAITAMLAKDLGLPVPEPFLVRLSAEFIASIQDKSLVDFLKAGSPFGFGSSRLPNGFATWIVPPGKIRPELDLAALEIMALDCWLTNPDRRQSNHNLLTNGNEFSIFDHELALMTNLNLFWREPWLSDALMGSQPPLDHVFYPLLRGRATYALDSLCSRMAAITDARIEEYVDAIPPEWSALDDTASVAKAFIIALRDNVLPAANELKKALV